MHTVENRVQRVSKRLKANSAKHLRTSCRVLKKYKVERPRYLKDTPSRSEPIRLLAYESINLPLTILAFLEAGNRKRLNRLCQSPAKQLKKDDNLSDQDQIEENLYCECKRPYCPGELMFKCEGFCEGWYHPDCIRMKPDEVERQKVSNERWYCPSCVLHAKQIVLDTTYANPAKKHKIVF